jgi:hypothetical protein
VKLIRQLHRDLGGAGGFVLSEFLSGFSAVRSYAWRCHDYDNSPRLSGKQIVNS